MASTLSATAAAPLPLDISGQGAPVFTVYSARDGLSDEIWNTVAVAPDGFAWAGSASELARFDGYRWRLWPLPQARSLVRQVQLLADGSFWAIFEREGLARYEDGEWQLVATDAGRLFGISQTHGPGGPEAWLGAEAGLLRRERGEWVADAGNGVGLGDYVNVEFTSSLFGGPRQWLLSNETLRFREFGDGRVGDWQVYTDPQLAIVPGTDLVRSQDGVLEELWVLTYGAGITRLRADGIRSWRAARGELPTEAIYMGRATHDVDGRRNLWVASRAGLLRLRDERFEVYDRRHGLPSDAVRSLEVAHADGADQLWLATEGGIVRASLGASQWRTVSLLGARENGIFGVLLEPDGRGSERMWTGSFKEGLALLEGGRWRQFKQADGTLPAEGVRVLQRLVGPDRRWWRVLGLVDGSVHRIRDDYRFERIPVPWSTGAGDMLTYALSREHAGAIELWFATLRSGVYRLRNGAWTQFLAEPGHGAVLQLREQVDRAGRSWLWAASGRGLSRFDGERWSDLGAAAGLPEDGYRSLALIDEGGHAVLWIGSNRHGVVRLTVDDPAAPTPPPATEIPPPPDPTVYSTLADSTGRIYVCTNNGVQQLTPGADGGYGSRVFRRRDGLVHDECNTNSQLVDGADRYWAGTLGGLGVFDPRISTADAQQRPKPLRWVDLQVDGSEVRAPADAPLRLPPGTRELRIGYALLTGEREEESSYQAWLHGYDSGPGAGRTNTCGPTPACRPAATGWRCTRATIAACAAHRWRCASRSSPTGGSGRCCRSSWRSSRCSSQSRWCCSTTATCACASAG